MKRTTPQPVSAIIDQALRQAGIRDTAMEHRAAYLWAEVMGPGVARHTARRWVAPGGEMHVVITSAPLKNELSFLAPSIVRALNRALGEEVVTKLVIH